MSPRKKRWPAPAALRWLAFGLFVVTLAATALTAIDYGIASDTGNYFYSSLRQLTWGRDLWTALLAGEPTAVLNRDQIFEHWRWYIDRIPHPPISRELSGFSWVLLRNVTDPLSAYRGAVVLTFAALAASVGVYTAWRSRSLAAGLAAGLAVPAFPVLFVKQGGSGWFFAAGVFLGAAIATKFSGLLLLGVATVWLLGHRAGLSALLALFLAAFLVFVAVNPVVWVDPLQGVRDYVLAGTHRAESGPFIGTEYFGAIYYFKPPWHYPYVWTAIVFPPTILAATVAGLFAPRSGALRGVVLLNMVALYGALALPSAPMHDGVRLFLPLFPFYCVLAGTGAVALGEWIVRRLEGRVPAVAGRRDLVVALAILSVLAPAAFRTAQVHPHQLSYFNALVGGIRGADEKGLEVTNLKEVLNRATLEELAGSTPPEAVVDPGFFMEEMCFYQAIGWAPPGWKVESQIELADGSEGIAVGCEGQSFTPVALDRRATAADFVFVLNRKAQWRRTESALVGFGGLPWFTVSLEGVPLMMVYRTR
jgi:hypothetical protein